MALCGHLSVKIPYGTVFLVLQESPTVGHGQRGGVGHRDLSTTPRAVKHTPKVHCGGGKTKVGELDLSMQLHNVPLRVSPVV